MFGAETVWFLALLFLLVGSLYALGDAGGSWIQKLAEWNKRRKS